MTPRFSRIRQRRVEPDALLAATCLCVLLVDPWAIVDLGGWLSAAALWGATTFSRLDRPEARCHRLVAHAGLFSGSYPGYGADHGCSLGTVAVVGIVLNFWPFRSQPWLFPAC